MSRDKREQEMPRPRRKKKKMWYMQELERSLAASQKEEGWGGEETTYVPFNTKHS